MVLTVKPTSKSTGSAPDQLCSKTFGVNHSSRPDYCAHSRRQWIAAMKTVYKHGNLYAGFLQKHYPTLYLEGIWLNGGELGCGSPCTGIHTRTDAATNVLGRGKSSH